MKKLFGLFIVLIVVVSACGPSQEELEAKRVADSTRVADSLAQIAYDDSVQTAEEEAAAAAAAATHDHGDHGDDGGNGGDSGDDGGSSDRGDDGGSTTSSRGDDAGAGDGKKEEPEKKSTGR